MVFGEEPGDLAGRILGSQDLPLDLEAIAMVTARQSCHVVGVECVPARVEVGFDDLHDPETGPSAAAHWTPAATTVSANSEVSTKAITSSGSSGKATAAGPTSTIGRPTWCTTALDEVSSNASRSRPGASVVMHTMARLRSSAASITPSATVADRATTALTGAGPTIADR